MSSDYVEFYFFLSDIGPFYYCFLTNCPARTSSATGTGSGESLHPCLVLDCGESFQCFTIKYDVSCGFSQMSFIRLRKFPSVLNFLSGFLKITKQC